jgi:hypothetical protein
MAKDFWSARVCYEAIRARGNSGIALFIGAGCSVTAGIEGADWFVGEIREQFAERCTGLPDDSADNLYEQVTSKLSDDEWRKLFGVKVRQAKLNVTHLCIAELVDQGIVDRILTTNFDSLLVHACALGERFPLIHDCAAADPLDDWIDESGEAIFYLHGQEHGRKMLNPGKLDQLAASVLETKDTEDDPAKEGDPLKKLLKARAKLVSKIVMGTVRRRPLIVCGYSGLSDKVFKTLQSADDLNNPVFWVTHTEADAIRAQQQFGRDRLKDRVFVIPDFGADEFFYELLLALGKEPPPVLRGTSPFTDLVAKRIKLPSQEWEEWKSARVKNARGPVREPREPSDGDAFAELVIRKEAPAWEESYS